MAEVKSNQVKGSVWDATDLVSLPSDSKCSQQQKSPLTIPSLARLWYGAKHLRILVRAEKEASLQAVSSQANPQPLMRGPQQRPLWIPGAGGL